ncbi:MAG TPA: PAS domain S-box protein [Bacteroidales bacterium]|nr:PAS domain S-box protein [Bacteroidales bacterium]
MNNGKETESDLKAELSDLQNKYNSMKELYLNEISELKLAHENLRRNEEKYRTAYMTSSDAININRLSDGMYVSINEGFTNMLGYTVADTAGKTSLEMNIWADPGDRSRMVEVIRAKGEIKDFEARFLSKNGESLTGSFSARLIDLDGVSHILSVVRDITTHKNAEEALVKEQFLINALMNNLSDHVYFKDIESRFIRNNKAHALSFGLKDPEELVGKSDFDFFTEQAARQAYEDEQMIIKTGQPIIKEEKLTRKDRSDAWFSAIKMPLWNKERQIIGTFGISRDITERKRSEFENYALFEITRGITSTNNLDELLKLIHHSLSKVVYAENCFIALYEKKSEMFSFPYFVDKVDVTPTPTSLAKSCSAYVYRTVKPLLLTQQKFDKLVESGEVELIGSNSPSWVGIPLQTLSKVIGVLVLQHYDNENVYSENDVRFLSSIGSQIAIAIDRKKTEEEIKLKNELLQAINAEKDKFFSIIAHDLRGPLSAFVAATQIITEEIQNMSMDEIKEIAESMKASATNIYSLLENLLEWSRLKRGGIDFLPEKLNLKKKIVECVDVLSESARKKGINVEIKMSDEIDVFADSHMFDAVIRNLVSNAIKFTNRGGLVNVSAVYIDHTVEIKIKDSGIGMPTELKNRLFQINEKISRPGTEGELSTGLGLLLCKEFVEKNNGKIWAESEPGIGSTFYFTMMQCKE